jgi:O-antigen ligase
MKKARQLSKSTDVSPVRWILSGLAGITLYFQTNLADPFNSPKLWILIVVAAWLVGYIASFRNLTYSIRQLKLTYFILFSFIFFALLATILTDFKYVAFFGDTQRRNGFCAYLSLAIIMLATSFFVRIFNIRRLYVVTLFIASISAFYALMQTTGKDFVKWNNPYNSIIGTVGNPNFAAAVMAVMGVIIFSIIFINEFAIYNRIYAGILASILLGLIIKSGARQGLLAYILGAGIFLIIWLHGKTRKLAVIATGGGVLVFIFSLLGMLQIGPLEKFLYKPSVSVRGYYWRAGLEMFRHHPFFGVGMDRYGAYFKQYREVGYPLSYGFDITSSNAHNTFIQLFATGGFFFGASYLLLNAYVLRRAIVGLKNLSGNNRLLLGGVFSAWIAFHAQSLVSIDNIGISIWGWVLGGSIIGLSISLNASPGEDRKIFLGRQSDINLKRVLTSGTLAILAIFLVTFLYRGESNSYKARGSFNLQDQSIRLIFRDLQLKAINTPLLEPTNKLTAAMYLIQGGFTDEGIVVAKKILADDPRNLDALNGLALTSEQLNKIPDAIIYREKMAKLDPWNAVNYLELGKDYKAQGNLVKSKEILDKILTFASNNPIAEQAKTELAS